MHNHAVFDQFMGKVRKELYFGLMSFIILYFRGDRQRRRKARRSTRVGRFIQQSPPGM